MFHRDNIPVILAITFSVGLHIVAIPIVYSDAPSMAYMPPANATHLETPRTDKQDTVLGIDESNTSTLTWIGYKEYEEQRARFAPVEQASKTAEAEEVLKPFSIEQFRQLAAPISALAKEFLDAMKRLEISMPPQLVAEPADVIPIQHEQGDASSIQHNESSPSDRDSDATSVVRISPENWKAGKPVAAKGLVLRPTRPSFTANQLATHAPSNLVAALYIDKRGKPMDVVILLGTGSGSIDRCIEASLYRWRASGKRIDDLDNGETVKITINIMFSN